MTPPRTAASSTRASERQGQVGAGVEVVCLTLGILAAPRARALLLRAQGEAAGLSVTPIASADSLGASLRVVY
jgi:hypothetical protein